MRTPTADTKKASCDQADAIVKRLFRDLPREVFDLLPVAIALKIATEQRATNTKGE